MGSVKVAMDKAKSSALFRRPTTAFETGLKAGNTYLLQLADANGVPGGRPIVVGGKVIGGIGVSGATGAQDGQCAAAGLCCTQLIIKSILLSAGAKTPADDLAQPRPVFVQLVGLRQSVELTAKAIIERGIAMSTKAP
jgi:hypothetical protein